MDKDVQCFLCEETEQVDRALRRYASGDCSAKALGPYCHNAKVWIEPGTQPTGDYLDSEEPDKTDQRWPKTCACGYEFKPEDPWQVFPERVYRRLDTGELIRKGQMPPGAMWYAWWLEGTPMWTGPDGRALMVRLPDGHDWHVDGIANNCTKKDDLLGHKCWVRTGAPPRVTASKTGGLTCSAGAGSILTPNWHGFLTDGILSTSREPARKFTEPALRSNKQEKRLARAREQARKV